jgi:hypothetical protein
MDPHFVFTLFSLVMSLSVFVYYLFQLMFRTDWKATTPTKARSSTKSAESADEFRKLNNTGGGAQAAKKRLLPASSSEKRVVAPSGDDALPPEQELSEAVSQADRILARIQARMTANKMESVAARQQTSSLAEHSEPAAPKEVPRRRPLSSVIDDDDEAVDITLDAKLTTAPKESSGLRQRRAAKAES